MEKMKLRTTLLFAVALAALLAPAVLLAQAPTAQPAPAPQAAPPAKASWHPDNEYWRNHDALLLTDFPWLARFQDDNAKLAPPAPAEKRVVFMGDSITEGFHLDTAFPGKPYINRGISGQTTPQMVLRFHQDVIALKPRAVVILGGINDIAENTGPSTLQQIEDNLAAMAEMAQTNGIKVVLCSVLPAVNFTWHPGLTPAPRVAELNQWLKTYAAEKKLVYVDYYSAMKDDRGGQPSNLSRDGVHPNLAGQAIMIPLVQAGIEKALKSGKK